MSTNVKKTRRDFFQRNEDERDTLVAEVWCHRCQDVNLGLDEPVEYEGNGMIILEGKCSECGSTVVAEIVQESV